MSAGEPEASAIEYRGIRVEADVYALIREIRDGLMFLRLRKAKTSDPIPQVTMSEALRFACEPAIRELKKVVKK